ncbi:MAG TPA: deoxyribodipyrimidine photo-lyase [Bryobacteraceae bacterium]|jgi:deoxyribodipyrimidine photo-lyase|nr:deoxyribodipyrimidine photo-lyase [Bryobacteraceae bacterium]
MPVESERIAKLNKAEDRTGAEYVLYWAQMNRRVDANHGLLYAVELANKYGLPVLYYEGLTCTYEYANDRLHTFILQGVEETAKRLKKAGIGYVFYLRRKKADRNDVLYELAKKAAAVVTDDYPTFIARQHNSRVPDKLDVSFYAVDSSCVVPMSQITARQYGAYTIRPRIKKVLNRYLREPDPLKVNKKFTGPASKFHTDVNPESIGKLVASCEIDHSVKPSLCFTGGRGQAEKLLDHFLLQNLRRFGKDRNEPSKHATSHMSPYLHFGRISSLEIALAVSEYANKHKLIAEEYLEELIVRRELAFNYARFVEDPGNLKNLPDWCQQTMKKHAGDKREPLYSAKQMQNAETGDRLWNATQKEMMLRGKIHGYYRMYWGKKIISWSRTYQGAADLMIDIHGHYALDGRDPNTYTNVLWCFGLHDRAWGERAIFGKIRYMSLEGMERKTNTTAYIEEIETMEKTGKDSTVVV